MEKEYMINYLKGRINELESLTDVIEDDVSLKIINAKLAAYKEILEHTENAPIPYDLI